MIKINLLPHCYRPQPERYSGVRMQLAIGVGVLSTCFLVSCVWAAALFQTRDVLLQEHTARGSELMRVLEGNHKEPNRKKIHDPLITEVYSRMLQGDQHSLPIVVFDEISKSLEPLELWLVALTIEHNEVSIEGLALSRGDIAKFIRNLETSSIFGELIRMETDSRHIHGEDIQQFTFQFTVES